KDHFIALANHYGPHEESKATYLPKMRAYVGKHFPEAIQAWQQQEELKLELIGQSINWLTAYRDAWWSRAWVSSDRKKVATTLINDLQQAKDSQAILSAIAKARLQILNDDRLIRFGRQRPIKAGINGRLWAHLEALEARAIAMTTAKDLD